MKKDYNRKLQAFLRILIAIVILLMLFLNRIRDFIQGFLDGLVGKEGIGAELQFQTTIASVVFIVLIFFVISHIAKKFISDPVGKIADNMNKVSTGDYDVRMEVKDRFEFGEMEEAFNNMVAGLKEARTIREKNDEQNRQLYAGIAHDLKTPMTMVMGYAKLLKEENISDEDRKHYLTIIEQQIKAANVQLEDMLEYAKCGPSRSDADMSNSWNRSPAPLRSVLPEALRLRKAPCLFQEDCPAQGLLPSFHHRFGVLLFQQRADQSFALPAAFLPSFQRAFLPSGIYPS